MLSLVQMKVLNDTIMVFIRKCEDLSGEKGYTLRHTMLTQQVDYLKTNHDRIAARLTETLDKEDWKQIQVAPTDQAMVNRVCGLGRLGSEAVISLGDTIARRGPRDPRAVVGVAGGGRKYPEHLVVAGRPHCIVHSAIVLEAVLGE